MLNSSQESYRKTQLNILNDRDVLQRYVNILEDKLVIGNDEIACRSWLEQKIKFYLDTSAYLYHMNLYSKEYG